MKVNVPSKKVNNSILAASRYTLVFRTLPLIGATGVLTSPNFGYDYAGNLNVKKMIQVEEGLVVSLQFTAFEIEFEMEMDGEKSCADFLTIEDGHDTGDYLMNSACGSPSDEIIHMNGDWEVMGSSLPTFTSTSNIVKFTFNTDGDYDGPGTGWSVTWTAVAPGECQPSLECFLCLFLILSFSSESPLLAPQSGALRRGFGKLGCAFFEKSKKCYMHL